VPLESLVAGSPSGLLLRYDTAFSFPETDGGVPFRWAGGAGHLIVYNPTSRSHRATLRFDLRPAHPSRRVVAFANGYALDRRSPAGDLNVVLAVAVPAYNAAIVSLDSENDAVAGNPGGRVLRYQVRDARILEPQCTARE
jgi:hypothetical protein